MNWATVLLAAALAGLAGPRAAAPEGPVWFWFASCGGPAMTIEIQLDRTTVYKSVVPICRADRESPVGQGQQIGTIELSFKPGRSIAWEGYRDETQKSKAGRPLEIDVWQAGADPDDLVIGVTVMDPRTIYMNTLHVAHPGQRDQTEIATGLTLATYPAGEEAGATN